MSEKKNIKDTKMIMENWDAFLKEGIFDRIKQSFSKSQAEKHKQYFGDRASSTGKQPPQPVPDDDFDEKTIELDPSDIQQDEPEQVQGPLSSEEIEKMISDEFKSISTKAAFLIKNKLVYTLKDIERRLDSQISGLDISPGHRLNQSVRGEKMKARELAKGMLTRLKTALRDIQSNPTGTNQDPGDLERAASVVNQGQLEETIDRVFSNFLTEQFNTKSDKKIVIEIKRNNVK